MTSGSYSPVISNSCNCTWEYEPTRIKNKFFHVVVGHVHALGGPEPLLVEQDGAGGALDPSPGGLDSGAVPWHAPRMSSPVSHSLRLATGIVGPLLFFSQPNIESFDSAPVLIVLAILASFASLLWVALNWRWYHGAPGMTAFLYAPVVFANAVILAAMPSWSGRVAVALLVVPMVRFLDPEKLGEV